jgi:AMMECR1 domain-containing protein
MARSVLLQLARDSIEEVLEAKRKIEKKSLISEHPLLNEQIDVDVKLYLKDKLRGASNLESQNNSLIENIILNSKKAAFEDKNFTPLSTSEYLECEVEIELKTPNGDMKERDPSILSTTEYSLEKELND